MANEIKARILVADDQSDLGEALRFLFKAEGWRTELAQSPVPLMIDADVSDAEFEEVNDDQA